MKLSRRQFGLLCSSTLARAAELGAPDRRTLRVSLTAEPRSQHPLLASEQNALTLSYLTGGVLVRMDRQTLEPKPAAAESFQMLNGGKTVRFTLRPGLRFHDGTPCTVEDVVATISQALDPKFEAPVGDSLRAAGDRVSVAAHGTREVTVDFPKALANALLIFDEIPILSSRSPLKEKACLGPYFIEERSAGVYLSLKRNPHFRQYNAGQAVAPSVERIRLEIQSNRSLEFERFLRGELDMIDGLDADLFERLSRESSQKARDLGPSLEPEFFWFNQVPTAPIPEYKRAWFRSTEFRLAISEAINRSDLVRLAHRGHAVPATGPISPGNRVWCAAGEALRYDPTSSMKRLTAAGFRQKDGVLRDAQGHAVEFSLMTNAGNRSRERMCALIQQDLARLGIRVFVTTLDFPSLVERISRSFQFDACLLGHVNVRPDPSAQVNTWLSSSMNPWNPMQKQPSTPWEARIDELLHRQASLPGVSARKPIIDEVQRIIREQAPIVSLVYKNALAGISPRVGNMKPSVVWPKLLWNVEQISLS